MISIFHKSVIGMQINRAKSIQAWGANDVDSSVGGFVVVVELRKGRFVNNIKLKMGTKVQNLSRRALSSK